MDNKDINQDIISETFQPVEDEIDFNGPYSNVLLIASTPTSTIYRVSRAGKTMLLKVPSNNGGRSLDLLKREYSLAVGLNHPSIASVYTWETTTPLGPGILMEYVDGRSLRDFILENPPLKARQRVFGQILDAVNYIHKHGVTHNDLKPTNIMVSRTNDDVKIIDFGLADIDGETTQRQLGGTQGYSSPELRARDRKADMRSDIYSLGVIMRDLFPKRYRRIWQKCLSEKPNNRYTNVDSLIRAWNQSLRRPTIIWIGSVSALVVAILILGGIRMTYLTREVENYTESSKSMIDTISSLRLTQVQANDTISKLNQQLGEINREKSLADSLINLYKENTDAITNKYLGKIKNLRCSEEGIYTLGLYNKEMDAYDEQFLKNNPQAGLNIVSQYSQTFRLQGDNQLYNLIEQLPSISNFTDDPLELTEIIRLIQAGKPWHLKSDSVK